MYEIPWFKTETTIFSNRKIQIILKLPEGDTYFRVWIQLIALAVECNNRGRLEIGENNPMTIQNFSKIMEKSNKKIEKILKKFLELEMLKKEGKTFLIKNWDKYQSIEKYEKYQMQNRERQRKYREKHKSEIEESNVIKMLDNEEEKNTKDIENKKEENSLTDKQAEKVKVNGIQKVDLNTKVDGKENLAQRLDLKEYDSIFVIYSDNIKDISKKSKEKINNTTYSLVGMKNDGTAKVLNDEFEMDKTVGNNASREQTKVRADSTATRDNKDQSVYTRKSNGASIGCENDMGNVNMFLYQKTKEENENVGIQIETSKTKKIPVETRRVFNRNQGVYQNDKVQDEIEEHTENGCEPKDVKDFDGKEYTETHEHIDIDYYVRQIQNYENEDGEQSINEVFTEKEIKDKLLRDLDKYKDKISTEQIIENVKNEMDADAQIYTREHKLEQ